MRHMVRCLTAVFMLAWTWAAATPAFAQVPLPPPGKAWGFNASLQPPGMPSGDATRQAVLDAAEAAGTTHMRLILSWRAYENENESSVTQPVPASFSAPLGAPVSNGQTQSLDADYLAVTGAGMTPIIVIHSAPWWASTFHRCGEEPLYPVLNPSACPDGWRDGSRNHTLYTALDRWSTMRAFATAVAERYPLAIIEGTNEPELHKATQSTFHPPTSTVAEGQCALEAGVRAATANPDRLVLSAGMYSSTYYTEWLQHVRGRGCFDRFSSHLYGFQSRGGTGDQQDVRSGPHSNLAGALTTLKSRLAQYGDGQSIWITETGVSSTARYGDNPDRAIGEDLAAHAIVPWVTKLALDPDVTGLLVHSIRDCPYANEGCSPTRHYKGLGQVDESFAVKPVSGGALPRWCWFVLSAGRSYPGCEGTSLPAPGPAAPSFYRSPIMSAPPERTVENEVLFFEDGSPAPSVTIRWRRCDTSGANCTVVSHNRTYTPVSGDFLKRLKVEVTLDNGIGNPVTASSPLSGTIL